jgi:hypothetical protein
MESLWRDWQERFLRTVRDVPWYGPAVSAVLIASFVNVLTEAATRYRLWLGWVTVGGMALAALSFVYVYARVEERRRTGDIGPPADRPNPERHRGLMFLFSKEQTLREAIRYHQPVLEHCWLLVTPEMQERAGRFVGTFPGLYFTTHLVKDLYDSRACYQIVKNIYEKEAQPLEIPPDRIICDITGGTKPMTIGMIVACLEGGYPIEHVPTAFDAAGRPTGPLPPIQIVVRSESA